jgi:hypothetical protein
MKVAMRSIAMQPGLIGESARDVILRRNAFFERKDCLAVSDSSLESHLSERLIAGGHSSPMPERNPQDVGQDVKSDCCTMCVTSAMHQIDASDSSPDAL